MLVWLLHNMVLAALLAAGVALVCRWKRIGPALRHALWVLVLVRLILPPGVLTWPWRLPIPSSEVKSNEAATAGESASAGWGTMIEHVEIAANGPNDLAPELGATAPTLSATPATASEAIRWRTLAWWSLFAVWAVGAAVVAVGHLRGLRRLLKIIRLSEPAPRTVMKPVEDLAAQLGIKTPNVRVVDGLASPLVGGLLKPVLLWPKDLQNRLPYEGLKAVLVHELAHLRRHDHWVRWLEMTAACLWWWNPLFRLARQRVRCYAELACDAWVLTVLPRARRAYAEALLKVCESVARTAEPAPALGVNGDPADFERRLTMIMRESVACRVPRRSLLAVGALALLAIPGWSLGDPPPTPVQEERESEVLTLDGVLISENVESDDYLLELIDLDIEQLNQTPDREARLARLESQIQELLKEIQALKAERGSKKEIQVHNLVTRSIATTTAPLKVHSTHSTTHALHLNSVLPRKVESVDYRVNAIAESVHHRVTYSLPHAKAQALARFLSDNVKGSKMECSVAGDRLVVMTTAENLGVVDGLVRLVAELPPSQLKIKSNP
jgi:beta-lactamase regulating signal transducer with metallopeptidase domain